MSEQNCPTGVPPASDNLQAKPLPVIRKLSTLQMLTRRSRPPGSGENALNASERSLRGNVLAGMVGNVLEWYDFAVYGYLAPIVGDVFFPAESQAASLLGAFAAFAIGYAARPLGGALFGHIGDRIGRKPALILSVLLMGLATTCMGLLPSYDQIGITASMLLVILRILQGISVGGEFTGSLVFVAEHAPARHRAYYTSWPQCSSSLGFLLGSALGALLSQWLGSEAMHAWGWRVPFLIGSVIAVCGIVFRRHMTETLAMKAGPTDVSSPVAKALRTHWRTIVRMMAMLLVLSVGYYMIFIYVASYLTQRMHLSTARALDINTLALFVLILVIPIAAMLSDRFGRKPPLYVVSIGMLLFAYPLWWLMHVPNDLAILGGQAGFAVLIGIGYAAIPPAMAEMLPADVRCSAVSIGYNLCIGIFGGTTPLVATYLVERTADDFLPAYYLMATALISLLAIMGLKETAGKELE